ncbi:MAG: glycosyltransferase [Pseudomonadota bacterium]
MPLVSVIIPTFNRVGVIRRAVDSVLAQTFHDFELIVVDDGSSDNTQQVLDTYGGRIRVLRQENRGVSAARNAGIAASNGELVAFLDSDDEWMPEKLFHQTAGAKEKESFVRHTDEIWMMDGKVMPQKAYHRKQGGRFFERALERCLISPSSVMLSRELLDRVGWFDESLPAAEDYDLWLRITAFHEVDFVDMPLVVKHAGAWNQLSRAVPAIDRYRIAAILKIIDNPALRPEYLEAARRELARKCRIMALGCTKRGKTDEAEIYSEISRRSLVDHD